MPYVRLRGVDSYYEQHGAGAPVLLLHGGWCSAETWSAQIAELAQRFRVHAPERPGHGRTPDRPGPIHFDDMVADTVAYLDAMDIADAHLIGFSDGAITGLLTAIRHPQRVRSLVAISANTHPDAFGEDDESSGPDDSEGSAGADGGTPAVAEDEEPSPFRAAYARLSPDGAAHADVVLDKLTTMWKREPNIEPADLARITAPTLVLAGQHDSITTDHTIGIARAIPGAQLCIVPAAGHLSIQERPTLVNRVLMEFLDVP